VLPTTMPILKWPLNKERLFLPCNQGWIFCRLYHVCCIYISNKKHDTMKQVNDDSKMQDWILVEDTSHSFHMAIHDVDSTVDAPTLYRTSHCSVKCDVLSCVC
jgi:hypothetical protein